MQTRQMQTCRCRQVTLRALTQPKSDCNSRSMLQQTLAQVQFQGEMIVVTHNGEVLGFIAKKLPESLQALEESASVGALRKNLTLKALRAWASSGVVKVTFCGRHRVWFIAPKYQDQLPLPTLP
jgi:hypothetical protein